MAKVPIFNACIGRYVTIIKYLMEHGPNINKEDNDGKTPLIINDK